MIKYSLLLALKNEEPKFSIILIVMFFFITTNISAQVDKLDSNKIRVLRIDAETAKGAKVSDIFDEVQFIPLQTTKQSIFGQITQLNISNGRYIIFDSDTKSVLIFLLDGKFISRIKIDKKDNQEFDARGFKISKNGGHDVIEIFTGKYLMLFDLNGKFIEKKMVNKPYVYQQYLLSDSMVVNINYSTSLKDSIIYEVAITKDDEIKKRYFPFTSQQRKNDTFISGGPPVYTSENINELYFVRYYDYNIYRITPEGLTLAFQPIFPERNSIPIDFMTNQGFKRNRLQFFEKNKEIGRAHV